MSEIQEQILDAVKLLANSAVSQSKATLTIECEIVDIIDAAIGSYKVKYLDNQFEVYSNPSIVYQIGNMVYVIVPDGDFEKTKMIVGAVTPSAEMYTGSEEVDKYVEISNNLLNIGNVKINTYNSNIEVGTETRVGEFVIGLGPTDAGNTKFVKLFSDYIQNYNCFLLSAKIKTNISMDRRNTGNYGIKLSIPVKEDQGDGEPVPAYKDYKIDVNNIQGNPYGLTEFALQDLYIDWAEGTELDAERQPYFTIFVTDFTSQEGQDSADIWINDISFKAVDVLSEEQLNGYCLTLVSTEGNYFINDYSSSTKIITPILKVNGKNKKLNDYECYWFVEDSSITFASDDYFAIGGLGWKCLNPKINIDYNEEGRMTYQYVTDIYNLEVDKADVEAALRYKCVLIKDSIVVSGKILLKNLSSNIETKLVSVTGYSSFVKNTGYVDLIASISNVDPEYSIEIACQRYDKNGNYINNDFYEIVKLNEQNEEWINTEIKFPCSLVEDLNTINCTFYGVKTIEREEEVDVGTGSPETYTYIDKVRINLGSASMMVTTSDDFVYRLVVQNGDVLYKYDADGDSPMVADYDGPLSSRVSAIKPLSFNIYKKDGTEFNDTEYEYCNVLWKIPVNSMIKIKNYTEMSEDGQYYYIEGKGNEVDVEYTILNSYNVKKNNNSIFLTVDFQGITLTEIVNIKFIKDGAAGTNGSKYAGIITYGGYGYGEIDKRGLPHKFHPVQIQQDESSKIWKLCDPNYIVGKSNEGNIIEWKAGLDPNAQFGIKIYKDGNDITDNDNFTVKWSIFDKNETERLFDIRENNKICYISQKEKEWDLNNDKNNFVILEAKITISDKSIINNEEVIYAYYPIELSYFSDGIYDKNTVQIVPELDGGFDQVLYASDGTNPKYDNTNPFSYGDNLIGINVGKNFEFSWDTGDISDRNLNFNENSYSEERTQCAIKPTTKYDNGNSYNYVKTILTMATDKYEEIASKINNLEEQIEDAEKKVINAAAIKDNAIIFINSFNNAILNEYIEKAKSLLQYRGNMLNYMNIMIDAFKDLATYCSEKNIDLADFDCHYTEYNTVLNGQRRILYILGQENISLDNLMDLKYLAYKLTKQQIKKIKKKYGIPVWEELKLCINLFNSALGAGVIIENNTNNGGSVIFDDTQESNPTIELKYLGNYNLIKEQSEGKRAFTEIIKLFNNIINNENLNNLVNIIKLQEYINFKNQLESYVNKLTVVNSDIYIYDAIKNNIIMPCEDWFNTHKQDFYIGDNGQLAKDLKNAEIEYNELNSCLAQYKALAALPIRDLPSAYSKRIYHIKPIIMTLNRYEMSNLNGWDGNKLYTDPNNDEYLFAPQIGTGKKNNDNSFTGIVMGVKNFAKTSSNPKVGLFGYSSGIQSLFLNADDGSAEFGRSGGGQIIIDPNSQIGNKYVGLLYSYDFWKSYNSEGKPSNYSENNYGDSGMLIDLSTPQIIFGSRKFEVTSAGEMTAQGGGKIAGWKIGYNDLSSPNYINNKGIRLDAGNSAIYIKGQGTNSQGTTVNTSITINANNEAEIYSGSHNAINSTNNGFYLSENGLSIGSKAYISSAGVLRLGNGAVKNNSKHWTINSGGDGENIYSYIGYNATSACINYDGDEISGISGSANSSSVYLGTDGIRLGKYFAVSPKGFIWAEKLKLQNGAMIGDWTIKDGKIVGENNGGQIVLDAKGAISGGSGDATWSINRNGNATFTNITATGTINAKNGYIGASGNTVSSSGLAFGSGTMSLSNDKGNINFSTTGVDIKGKITATAGEIGGCSITGGVLQIKNANISEKLSVNKLASENGTFETQWEQLNLLQDVYTKTVSVKGADGNNISIEVFNPDHQGGSTKHQARYFLIGGRAN